VQQVRLSIAGRTSLFGVRARGVIQLSVRADTPCVLRSSARAVALSRTGVRHNAGVRRN
jgi:hypothetical protein